MSKQKRFTGRTKAFKKLDNKSFEVSIIETIEKEIKQNFTIDEIRSQIASKQKAIVATEEQKQRKIEESDKSIAMLTEQIATLEALIDEAKQNGVEE